MTGNANFSQERENADGSAWSEGIVSAGNNLNVSTGNNVNVVGGQLEGDTVKMDVGNDLNIQSLQDSDNYDYEKLSTSVGGSITLGPGSGGSANFSTSKTDMESNWASVTDQSGIYAGSGGFDITVGNNTDLKGGVIASDAEDKSKNKLDTGTISFEDIENKADFNVDHVSINVGVGGNNDIGYTPSPSGPSIYHNEGKDSSTTKSAVEEGTLIVRDTDKQTQDVNDLSRDTENANDPLGQIFDKQKEQDRMDALDLVKDITAQAHDVVNKYDLINAEEKYKGLSDSERDELKKKVEQELKDKGLPATDDAIDNYIINQFVQNDGIGNMGGSFSKGLDAASSIISGIITGDITGGLAGASAPYLAGLIKEQTKGNDEANRIAHAILGAAVAAAQGNSALAGGAGALTGEVMADIIRETLYGKDVKDLTEAEKQNISNLAQIASGLAVAAGGGSVSDVGTAASASKNAVENNFLGPQDQSRLMELRKKRDEGFLTDAEKIEMFMLDELDQKGDYLVGKYFQDRSSLTEEQLQLLANSLSRYYQQEEGMSGEQAAFQAVTDLLTGNWGYRANNYDYPYLSYDEHKEQYSDAYWKDYWNNLTIDNFLNSRPQDENEKYYNEAVLELALAKQLEWDQKVGRPVMNFLPGGVGLLFNGVDTVQAGYELAEVSKRLANGEELNTEMVLKLVNAGFTFVPVAVSTAIPKGPSKGTTGGVITDVDSLLPGNSSQITLPDGNNLTNAPNLGPSLTNAERFVPQNFANENLLTSHFNKHGSEFGVKTEVQYLEVGNYIINNGYKVEYSYRGENRTGYVVYLGNTSKTGESKFGFVGTNSKGYITTIHIESGKNIWKTINQSAKDKEIRPK